MKKKLNLILVLLTSLLCCKSFAENATASLSQLLKGFKTYFADFRQVTATSTGKVLQKSQGTIRIKRPGKFRWESLQPTHQLLITDGVTLWTYDIDLSQVTKQALSKRTSVDPAMLLSGSIKNLNSNFRVSATLANGAVKFKLLPKQADLGFSEVDLIFKDKKLINMKIVNSLSQVSTFSFSHVKLNESMPDSLFTFKPKPGIDIITE